MEIYSSVGNVGEAGLISRLMASFPPAQGVSVGPGDDGAVVPVSGQLVMTTDSIVENIDFILGISSAEDVGRKLAVQNLADVAAMGADPKWLLYTAMMPAGTSLEVFEGIARGLGAECEKHSAVVVGGDLGTARDITLSVTAFGLLEGRTQPVLRSGANEGDLLVLGAPIIGMSAAGLAQVLAEAGGYLPGLGHVAELAHRTNRWHCAPDPDLSLGYRYANKLRAMIDVSDGLVRDGRRIAVASGRNISVDSRALEPDVATLRPLAEVFETDPWEWVLGSGEEHAMLATVDRETWASVPEMAQHFRVIGKVQEATARPDLLLDGEQISMRGFDHFERD